MAVRMHYLTICYRDNTVVTHIERDWGIEVTFEQACTGGFKTLITTLDGEVLRNDGFSDADVGFFLRFLSKNAEGILMESKGEI